MNKQTWRFLDHSTLGLQFDPLQSFAYDDTFATLISHSDADAFIRPWVHEHTVVLGIQDSRLPYIDEARRFLEEQGYHSIVRNSGGLAVPLDDGILNISLILRETKGLSIDAAYEEMYTLIKKVFSPYGANIEAYEIVGSYCPGNYDLSISGKKFAGTSQRRIRGGVAVQVYLCVTGSGSKRAELIRSFYEIATRGEEVKFTYPSIVPSTMASLTELLGVPLTVQDVVKRLLETLQEDGIDIVPHSLSSEEITLFQEQYGRMIKRNEKLLFS